MLAKEPPGPLCRYHQATGFLTALLLLNLPIDP